MEQKELSIVLRDKVENYTFKDKRWYSLSDFDGEQWHLINGYGDVYYVSNYGRVKTIQKERISGRGGMMKYKERILRYGFRSGYLGVTLCYEGRTKTISVHRLVANAFIPNPEEKPEIDHINTKRHDNRVCNLRWATKKENANNPITIENKRDNYVPPMKGVFGKDNPLSIPIVCISTIDGTIVKYDSISDAHRESGLSLNGIARCVRGERKTYHCFRWVKQSDYNLIYGTKRVESYIAQ